MWLEFEEAAKWMKEGKAAGVDELPIELIKRADAVGKQCLYFLRDADHREI